MNKQRNLRGQLIPFIQNAEYFFQRALSYHHQNNLYKAKQFLLRAIKIEEEEASYICQLAAVLSELGEYTKANEWLEHVLREIDPTITECHYYLANNYAHLGQFEKAEEEALYYLEVEPDGEFSEDAEELLYFIGTETPIDVEENEIIQKHMIAKKQMESGQFEEAIIQFTEMILEHPNFWAAYNNLALAYFYSGQKTEALSTLEEVLTKNPGNLHALCNLALFSRFLGFKEQCKTLIERLQTVYPIHDEHRYKLGSTFALLYEHEYAYKWLASVNKSTLSEDLPFHHWLAVAAFMTGRESIARSAWQQVRRIDPDGEIAPHYLQRLEEGTLTEHDVQYQYRLVKKNKSYFDFLTEGLKDNERSKLLHLYILRKNFNEEGYAALETFCESDPEPLYLKELAAYVMLKQIPNEPIIIKHQGLEMIYKQEAQVSQTVKTGLRVVERLQRSLIQPGALNDIIYRLWSPIFKRAHEEQIAFINDSAWAAATEYVWRRRDEKVTQKEIASHYRISSATLSKYVKKMKHMLKQHT